MKNYNHFFGVDISKKTIDVAYANDREIAHQKFENNPQGMEHLLDWVKGFKVDFTATIFCMEATGLYCFTITNFLLKNEIDVWVEHASKIKHATALARGKNDKVDAKRIATYALKYIEQIRLWKPMAESLQKIKHLTKLRERLIESKKRIIVPIKEFEEIGNEEMAKILTKTIAKTIVALDKDLKKVEAAIMKIITEDEGLKMLYQCTTSVVGIGMVTAINLIVYTNGFTQMVDVKKLACYCGVAPFEYSSGTSIRGKTKVHHMANKTLKCNLHMASLTAIKLDSDIKTYYDRKVAEGKNKMSVLNAVRNKLLGRVISCVKNKKHYVNNLAKTA